MFIALKAGSRRDGWDDASFQYVCCVLIDGQIKECGRGGDVDRFLRR